jgi:hypothetical protein
MRSRTPRTGRASAVISEAAPPLAALFKDTILEERLFRFPAIRQTGTAIFELLFNRRACPALAASSMQSALRVEETVLLVRGWSV